MGPFPRLRALGLPMSGPLPSVPPWKVFDMKIVGAVLLFQASFTLVGWLIGLGLERLGDGTAARWIWYSFTFVFTSLAVLLMVVPWAIWLTRSLWFRIFTGLLIGLNALGFAFSGAEVTYLTAGAALVCSFYAGPIFWLHWFRGRRLILVGIAYALYPFSGVVTVWGLAQFS